MNLREIAKTLGSSLEARMIVKHYTGLTDSDLIGLDTLHLTEQQSQSIQNAIEKRLQKWPVSKIIGYKEFYGRNFITNEHVLDPRPETEQIVDLVKRHAHEHNLNEPRILDLGTGSGCLALTLLCELPNATGIASDISSQALETAQKNAQYLNVNDKITFIKSNWLDQIQGTFDIIVSNPPYIERHVVDNLDIEVKQHDPLLALDGGGDGLTPYKIICPQIRPYLNKHGLIAFEHGTGQSNAIHNLLKTNDFNKIEIHYDYAGHDRIVTAQP